VKFIRINKNNRYQPEIKAKTGYMGRFTENGVISKRRNILITGAHHSGKTKGINRLYEDAENIWYHQVKPYKYTENKGKLEHDKPILERGQTLDDWQFPEPVFLSGLEPISKWYANDGVIEWWNEKNPERPHNKIPAWKRVEILPEYLADTRAILFIDDAHKLTGRKLQIAKLCMESAYRVVMTASDENRLSPNIRRTFLETKPQVIRLNSDVAYDATHIVIWFFVVLLMITGSTELAMALGAFEMLKGGRRGAKQD